MSFLVIGGAGYIGSHFVRWAQDQGHEVSVLDSLVRGHRASLRAGTRLFTADVRDRGAVTQALRETRPTGVFHFAALALVGESVTDPGPYFDVNVNGTVSLLAAMRDAACDAPLVFSSTCAVYGVPERFPIVEDAPKNPINPYGRSKLMAEWALADHAAAYGMRVMALRYFNAAGADPSGDIGEDHEPEMHLVPNLLKAALNDAPFTVNGDDFPTADGTAERDYVHVTDLARLHGAAWRHLQGQAPGHFDAVNLGTGTPYSIEAMRRAAESLLGRPIATRVGPRRPGDPPRLFADNAKMSRLLGLALEHSDPATILRTAWAWHQRRPHGYANSPQG